MRSFRLAFVEKWKIKRNIIVVFCFFIFASSQKVMFYDEKNGNVKIGLTNFVLIFHSKTKNALIVQLKLMTT